MRVVVLGPPAVGKSTVAQQLCDYFKLHHIHVKNVIDEAADRMVNHYILHRLSLSVSRITSSLSVTSTARSAAVAVSSLRTVCAERYETIASPSVSLSVPSCPTAVAAGLLLTSGAGSRYIDRALLHGAA